MRLVKIDDLNGSEVLAVPIMSAKDQVLIQSDTVRSEERRVGKECRSRWSPYH